MHTAGIVGLFVSTALLGLFSLCLAMSLPGWLPLAKQTNCRQWAGRFVVPIPGTVGWSLAAIYGALSPFNTGLGLLAVASVLTLGFVLLEMIHGESADFVGAMMLWCFISVFWGLGGYFV